VYKPVYSVDNKTSVRSEMLKLSTKVVYRCMKIVYKW